MLRFSKIFAAETYYVLKENELREIEQIEEGFNQGYPLFGAPRCQT